VNVAKIYRNKPTTKEAVLWDGDAATAEAFIGDGYGKTWEYEAGDTKRISILTLEGTHMINIGDYIIKGLRGEFYGCKPDVFERSYEEKV
jgi:hypothetical protein